MAGGYQTAPHGQDATILNVECYMHEERHETVEHRHSGGQGVAVGLFIENLSSESLALPTGAVTAEMNESGSPWLQDKIAGGVWSNEGSRHQDQHQHLHPLDGQAHPTLYHTPLSSQLYCLPAKPGSKALRVPRKPIPLEPDATTNPKPIALPLSPPPPYYQYDGESSSSSQRTVSDSLLLSIPMPVPVPVPVTAPADSKGLLFDYPYRMETPPPQRFNACKRDEGKETTSSIQLELTTNMHIGGETNTPDLKQYLLKDSQIHGESIQRGMSPLLANSANTQIEPKHEADRRLMTFTPKALDPATSSTHDVALSQHASRNDESRLEWDQSREREQRHNGGHGPRMSEELTRTDRGDIIVADKEDTKQQSSQQPAAFELPPSVLEKDLKKNEESLEDGWDYTFHTQERTFRPRSAILVRRKPVGSSVETTSTTATASVNMMAPPPIPERSPERKRLSQTSGDFSIDSDSVLSLAYPLSHIAQPQCDSPPPVLQPRSSRRPASYVFNNDNWSYEAYDEDNEKFDFRQRKVFSQQGYVVGKISNPYTFPSKGQLQDGYSSSRYSSEHSNEDEMTSGGGSGTEMSRESYPNKDKDSISNRLTRVRASAHPKKLKTRAHAFRRSIGSLSSQLLATNLNPNNADNRFGETSVRVSSTSGYEHSSIADLPTTYYKYHILKYSKDLYLTTTPDPKHMEQRVGPSVYVNVTRGDRGSREFELKFEQSGRIVASVERVQGLVKGQDRFVVCVFDPEALKETGLNKMIYTAYNCSRVIDVPLTPRARTSSGESNDAVLSPDYSHSNPHASSSHVPRKQRTLERYSLTDRFDREWIIGSHYDATRGVISKSKITFTRAPASQGNRGLQHARHCRSQSLDTAMLGTSQNGVTLGQFRRREPRTSKLLKLGRSRDSDLEANDDGDPDKMGWVYMYEEAIIDQPVWMRYVVLGLLIGIGYSQRVDRQNKRRH